MIFQLSGSEAWPLYCRYSLVGLRLKRTLEATTGTIRFPCVEEVFRQWLAVVVVLLLVVGMNVYCGWDVGDGGRWMAQVA